MVLNISFLGFKNSSYVRLLAITSLSDFQRQSVGQWMSSSIWHSVAWLMTVELAPTEDLPR